jgi:amino acid transporter
LFLQAIVVSIFCLVFVLMPSINAFYWFLTALSTELYVIMYVFMFASALKLGRPPREAGTYQIPRGIRRATCFLGLFGCLLTIVVGFFPPAGIDVGGGLRYALLIAGGNILLIAPAGLLLLYRKKRSRS